MNTRGPRYEIVRRIASGGMATVWLARDNVTKEHVAVKRMHPHLIADPDAVARFRREMAVVEALQHPNIAGVYETAPDATTPYMVMEYVEGPTLTQLVADEGPIAADRVCAMVLQIADALGAAHELGIVHRDVKPSNLIYEPASGRVVLTDFGIAFHRDWEKRLTADGSAIGTIDYLAPERAIGQEGGPSADVYSLGMVAYELLTGKPAFTGDTPIQVALAHQSQDPRPPSTVVDVSPAVEKVILTALEKHPFDRYEDGASLASALRAAMRSTSAKHRRPGLHAGGLTKAAAAATASLIGGLGAW